MLKWMEARIEVNDPANVSYTKPKFVIYSAHDTTLSAMQRFLIDAFGITYIYPPYSSVMHFELRKYDQFHVVYYFNLQTVLNVTFTEFKEKVNSIVFSDDEKVLELAQTFFEDIKVESIKDDETKQKVILHAKLNVFNSKDETFDLENFLLLFCKRQGRSNYDCNIYIK